MSYNSFSDIPIDNTDINAVAVHVQVAGDRLTGTVLQNKQVFDAYPAMITEHFNDLCDYISTVSPEGDVGLDYTATEITNICTILGCTQASITL